MIKKNEIYKIISKNLDEVSEYSFSQTNKEELSSNSNKNFFKNMHNIQNYNTNISSKKFFNPKEYDSLSNQNYNYESSENNVINKKFNDNLYRYNYLSCNNPKPPRLIKGNNLYFSPVISDIYLSNNNYKSNNHYNNSNLYNGYTTEEGENNLKYIYMRDSNDFSERPYQLVPIIDQEDEKENINNDFDDTNDEQLIIYPENKFNDKKEKLFDGKEKEGKLMAKDYQIYELDFIEYIPKDKQEYKPITFGDYILKNPSKMRKNKSCDDLLSNKRKINDYKIKVFTGRKNKGKKKIKNNSYCGESKSNKSNIYNIKTINKIINNKKINNNLIKNKNLKKEKKISKVLEHFRGNKYDFLFKKIKEDSDNEITYINKQKKNSSKTYHIINSRNYNSKKYPAWKVLASACLIQGWWRSLKILYKKYLNRIIIIQKIYKMHYKNKYLTKKKKKFMGSFSNKDDYDINGKKKSNSKKKIKPKNLDTHKKEIENKKQKYIYNKYIHNKQNINKFEKPNNFSFSWRNFSNNKFIIGALLIKKILENNLVKNFKTIFFDLKTYNNISISRMNNKNNDKNKSNYLINSNNEINDKNYPITIYTKKINPINIASPKNNNFINLKIISAKNNISFSYKNTKKKKIFLIKIKCQQIMRIHFQL